MDRDCNKTLKYHRWINCYGLYILYILFYILWICYYYSFYVRLKFWNKSDLLTEDSMSGVLFPDPSMSAALSPQPANPLMYSRHLFSDNVCWLSKTFVYTNFLVILAFTIYELCDFRLDFFNNGKKNKNTVSPTFNEVTILTLHMFIKDKRRRDISQIKMYNPTRFYNESYSYYTNL